MACRGDEGGRVGLDASSGGSVLTDADIGREIVTFSDVEERLVEAWGFLMRMPDRERGWQRLKACWPDMRRHNHFGDYGDMDADAVPKKPGLRTAEVDRMEEALGWIEWVKERDRKLVGVVLSQLQRASGIEWGDVVDALHSDAAPDALRMRFGRSLTRICNRLNATENRGVEAVKG